MATERRLSDLLSEFARTILTDSLIQRIPGHHVVRIAEVLPIGLVGVTLISATDKPRHVAAFDDSALRLVELQTELGEGPCPTVHCTGQTVAVPDLRSDHHFPDFAGRDGHASGPSVIGDIRTSGQLMSVAAEGPTPLSSWQRHA